MNDMKVALSLIAAAAKLTRRLDGSLSMIKGISFSEYQLLVALRDHPTSAATRVDLASAVGISPSGVTRALKPMEKLGFVETSRDARDARKSRAALTANGIELVTDAEQVVEDTLAKVSGVTELNDRDRKKFLRILAKVIHD